MRLVILEGCDRTGKTTLANQLVERHSFKYIHCGQPKGDLYEEYMQILQDIEKEGVDTVIDRFVYGEFVYGPLYRGEAALDEQQLRNIELKALSLNAMLIYCVDEAENIIKRFKTAGEDFAREELVPLMLNLYEDVIDAAIIPVDRHRINSMLDMTQNNGIETALTIHLVNKHQHIISAIGNQQDPKLVLVGDKRNDKNDPKYGKFGQPFDFGPASEHLFNELYRAHVPLSEVLIINSDSPELDAVGRFDTIVALGVNAATQLKKLKIKHLEVNHPSYERRFYHGTHRFADFFRTLYKAASQRREEALFAEIQSR